MVEMNANFVELSQVIDYKEEPCYKIYGLKHGEFSMNGELVSTKFRTSVQVRDRYIDFVKKFDDTLLCRFTGEQFEFLVKAWENIQKKCKECNGVFKSEYTQRGKVDGKKFEITMLSFQISGKWYPKMFINGVENPGMNLSVAEICHNDVESMQNIFLNWRDINESEPHLRPPFLDIKLGKGNPLSIESKPVDSYVTSNASANVTTKKKRTVSTIKKIEVIDADLHSDDGFEVEDYEGGLTEELDSPASPEEPVTKKFKKKKFMMEAAERVAQKVNAKKQNAAATISNAELFWRSNSGDISLQNR